MSLSLDSEVHTGPPMSRRDLILWWEKRRMPYNLQVGLAGLVSLLLVVFVGSIGVKPGDDFEEPVGLIILPIVSGIVANVCYTVGWILDISLYRGEPRAMIFQIGLMFSIALASLPGLWAVTAWLFTVYTGKKLD